MPEADPISVNPARPRRNHWRRVERAREHLDANAHRIMRAMVKKAIDGDVKAGRWLLEHTETTDDTGASVRPIAGGVDQSRGNAPGPADTAPRIVIGVSLGRDFAQLATQPTPAQLAPASPVSHPVSLDAELVENPSK